eukprot:CAMPEP_0204093970 /NCGR_PEP_ID=MMETSP0360-20130528/190688_1 /ASSEMBLY_ACC=CAM_ASM_000342 /TAXON_ID=268821 /ORGANISM="Scrippsiella Hangoei, Strain SHTV-5" /LENGTH=744 /DNA_ID=CAMNT_0051043277 /DNA_START=76 /DNA_END=2313 /DNA_ORIENTATION=+
MQFLADLRSKAAGSLTFVQTRLDEAKVQVTEFVMLAAAGVKQAAEKVSAPITSRIAGVLLTVKSARSAVLERAYQARAAVLDLATSTKARVVGLQADVQAKGIRACVQDRATSAQLLARESTASAKERAGELYTVTGELVSQKSFPTTAASATAGAVTLGAGGAATGAMTGGLAGAVAGLPLALFTFGLSIPAVAAVGGAAGGSLHEGGGVGLQANVQAKGIRACVQDLATFAQLLARESAASAKVRAGESLESTRAKGLAKVEFVRQQAGEAKEAATLKATQLSAATGELVSQKSFQMTAASATAGAVTLGASGAATGAVTGSLAGAVAGLPLALFTFGLSIPAVAAVGGAAGLVLGTAAGATTGFLGGGAAGYCVYQKKDEIRRAVSSTYIKASSGAELIKGGEIKSAEYAKDVVVAAKGRVERADTGDTAENTDRDAVAQPLPRQRVGELPSIEASIAAHSFEACASLCFPAGHILSLDIARMHWIVVFGRGAMRAVAEFNLHCVLSSPSDSPSLQVQLLVAAAGLVLGTVAGATTGFLGGGVAGYGVYQKKDDIRGAVSSAYTKASGGAELVKGRAVKSVEYAKDAVVAAKARLARAGTGEAGEHMDKFTDKEGRHRSDQLEACASLRLPAWSRALERTVKMSLSSRVTSMCTGWQPLQLQEHVDCKRGHLRQTQALAGWVLLPELATVAVKSVEYAKDVVVVAKGRLERAGTGETAENTDRDRSCTTATSSASEEVVPE